MVWIFKGYRWVWTSFARGDIGGNDNESKEGWDFPGYQHISVKDQKLRSHIKKRIIEFLHKGNSALDSVVNETWEGYDQMR